MIAIKLALLFWFAWNTRFVMDEFGQLGWAKYLGKELFDTIWPAKAAGSTAFYKLAHIIGWDARSILLIGRLQTALLACGTLALVYGCARALGEKRHRALAIVLALLCFSNFMERSFRTIAEPLALFFAAAALLAVLRTRGDRFGSLLAAGVLSGLSFLATQKAVFFNVALGLALVSDAALRRQFAAATRRGALLLAGWLLPIVGYCFLFGGAGAVAVASNLVLGPSTVVSAQIAAEYGGLRQYVWQTLERNLLLYLICFAGIGLQLLKLQHLNSQRRIALIFSVLITLLVFRHDQPWPYVFIMCQPLLALWSLVLIDHLGARSRQLSFACLALFIVAAALSFVRNASYLRHGNAAQLQLVERAEALLRKDERYFDGIGILPNRSEPSTLWLDRHHVLKTLREAQHSEAYRVFAKAPPKLILWSYRMNLVLPVLRPHIRDSYVQIAPNIRYAGRALRLGHPTKFRVPLAGTYALYDARGNPVAGTIEVGGQVNSVPVRLEQRRLTITLRNGPREALLLPEGNYRGRTVQGPDDPSLFARIYE
ncbi:MAG TPA: glycosyltransferase family 39 protein [Sphingomicrobium sp.]|nr:glycosyltransferase family 39 protein [Sphingomicrobium sp.]